MEHRIYEFSDGWGASKDGGGGEGRDWWKKRGDFFYLFLIGFPYAVPPCVWKSYTPTFDALIFIFGPDIILQFGDRLVALENKIDETLTESISVLKQVTFLP